MSRSLETISRDCSNSFMWAKIFFTNKYLSSMRLVASFIVMKIMLRCSLTKVSWDKSVSIIWSPLFSSDVVSYFFVFSCSWNFSNCLKTVLIFSWFNSLNIISVSASSSIFSTSFNSLFFLFKNTVHIRSTSSYVSLFIFKSSFITSYLACTLFIRPLIVVRCFCCDVKLPIVYDANCACSKMSSKPVPKFLRLLMRSSITSSSPLIFFKSSDVDTWLWWTKNSSISSSLWNKGRSTKENFSTISIASSRDETISHTRDKNFVHSVYLVTKILLSFGLHIVRKSFKCDAISWYSFWCWFISSLWTSICCLASLTSSKHTLVLLRNRRSKDINHEVNLSIASE